LTDKETKIEQSVNAILTLFKSGNLPQAMAKLVYPRTNSPFASWSYINKMICIDAYVFAKYKKHLHEFKDEMELQKVLIEAMDKADFRGFNQWKEKKRFVNAGSKASFILAPIFGKSKSAYEDGERLKYDGTSKSYKNKNGGDVDKSKITFKESKFIRGFTGVAVFAVADTHGKKLVQKKLPEPNLPFKEVAEFLNLKIINVSGNNSFYGSYMPNAKVIQLATSDQGTFYHELAHAVDDYIQIKTTGKGLKGGQQIDQEIVAQFSANVIAHMRGYKVEQVTAYTKKYLEGYAGDKALQQLMKLMSRVEKIVDFITNFETNVSPTRKAEMTNGEPAGDAEELATKAVPLTKAQEKEAEPSDSSKLDSSDENSYDNMRLFGFNIYKSDKSGDWFKSNKLKFKGIKILGTFEGYSFNYGNSYYENKSLKEVKYILDDTNS